VTPRIQFSAINQISLAPNHAEMTQAEMELTQTVTSGLVTFTVEQGNVTKMRASLRSENVRRMFAASLTSALSQPREGFRQWELPSFQVWALTGDLLGLLVSEAHAQHEACSVAPVITLLQSCFYMEQGAKVFLSDRLTQLDAWRDLDLWTEYFAVKLHNQLAARYSERGVVKRLGSLPPNEVESMVRAEWDETRTRFAHNVMVMETLGVSVSLIRKLMPIIIVDFNEALYQHLLEVLPSTTREKMKVAEDQQAATSLPDELAQANCIVAWLDDKISEPGLQHNIAFVKSEAMKRKKLRLEVLQFPSSIGLREWLHKYGQLAASKLRIVTNRHRKFDGGDSAAALAISAVRDDQRLLAVPVLIFCGNRQAAEPLLSGTKNVYLATQPAGLCDFCINGKL
jgi:hypothetical protein